jgi:hypothetical protein
MISLVQRSLGQIVTATVIDFAKPNKRGKHLRIVRANVGVRK